MEFFKVILKYEQLKNNRKKISQLAPALVVKLDDYLDFLLSQKKAWTAVGFLKQNWAGGLKEYKKEYSSLELQKLALKWRTK